ncbi:MAG TPA: hypothetical protein VE640_00615 [Candidatus Bathyarchaeia archaeon]|nr:hypothetical protein [Candidatus Bathyarchaeia archaeon]
MTKHSKWENERRKAETIRVKEIESAWLASLPSDRSKAFVAAVEAARSRPPTPPRENMPPGTQPRPPRPGHEPRPTKEERTRRPRD